MAKRLEEKPLESVLIIGAGVAGLSCARALQERGLEVTLFEKEKSPGGRLSSRVWTNYQCDDGAQYFTASHPRFRAQLSRWKMEGVVEPWQPRLVVFEGNKLVTRDSPTSPTERFVGVPSMQSLASYLAKDQALHLGKSIDKLRRSQMGWQVHSKEQGWRDTMADALVLALPAPQCLPLLQNTPSSINAKLATFAMRPTWAMMLRLDEAFDPGFDAAFINSGPLRWIAKDSSKPGRSRENVWLLHATTQWSEANVEQTEAQVIAALQEQFTILTGAKPLAASAHLWLYADTEAPAQDMCYWSSDLTLGVCGDWLAQGKVEGAWISGLSMAKKMINKSKTNPLDIEFYEVEFATTMYRDALALRQLVLRSPLGRSLDDSDLAGESEQLHYVYFDKRGDVVATLSVKKIEEKVYKLRQMAVREDYRGRGVGGMLVQQVERILRSKGCQKITLHARESAIGFYEKHAYKVCGDLFPEVGIAHVKMAKNLN